MAIKKKHQSWIRYIHCKTPANLSSFKTARNTCTAATRRSQYSYEKDLADGIKTKPKLFWKYVRSKTKTKETITKVLNNNNTLTSSDQETAEVMNNYFVSVFVSDANAVIPPLDARNNISVLDTITVNIQAVETAIKRLLPTKSPGPDNIHPMLITETKDVIKHHLLKIFQKSVHLGEIPQEWKTANVTPIFKKGSRTNAANYRPISLTSVPCKLLQRIIRDEIVLHMDRNNLFVENQHGFRSGRTCATQLLEALEDWTMAIDNGNTVDVIYLDFCKAFDKVSHRLLLYKLDTYGIRGKALRWISNFLIGAKQRVVINGSSSTSQTVTSGVPQGSVLGPVLFLIYVNDMPEVVRCMVKLFADDTKLYSEIKETADRTALQEDINKIVTWTSNWLMKLNIDKCKHMEIGNITNNSSYTLDNGLTTISKVNSEKDLGITFDRGLKFSEHVCKAVSKANQILGIIFRTFKFMDTKMFLILFKSMVRPHLEYSTAVWSPLLTKDKIAIENVQRRATKRVNGLSELSYHDRLLKLGLPTLEYRRLRADLIQTYKIVNNIDNISSKTMFVINNTSNTRGHSQKLVKKQTRTNPSKNILCNRVSNNWNSLPDCVVTSKNVNIFKSKLNNHWKFLPCKFYPSFY